MTGSVGKTTTKQMTYAAIAGFGSTIKTEGNQNNELGLPRTMFRIGRDTEYAVVEMGMSHAGEIERLAKCARPDVGIITCIGVSHIGNLGSQENICKAKLEICAGLAEGSPLVLNGDDPFLRKAALPTMSGPCGSASATRTPTSAPSMSGRRATAWPSPSAIKMQAAMR